MREVVDDEHPVLLAPDFQAAPDAAKARKRAGDLAAREPEAAGESDRAEGVADVVGAARGRGEARRRQARLEQRELRPVRRRRRRPAPRSRRPGPPERHARERRARRPARRPRRAGRRRSTTTTPSGGTSAITCAEGLDDGREVRVEVGVVVLDVADEEMPRLVVQELRSPVEEGRVVLVALEDEVRARARAGSPGRGSCDLAADEEPGIAARVEQQPGRQRRSRGLAVRPGDDDGGLAAGGGTGAPPVAWRGQAGPRRAASAASTLSRSAALPTTTAVAVGRDVLGREPVGDGDPEALEQWSTWGDRASRRCR